MVVGSGFGGLTAGLYLLQNGLSVTIVEKSSMVGGAGRHACNLHVNCGGTKAQAEIGYFWPTTDPQGNPLEAFDATSALVQFENLTGQHSIDTKLLMRVLEEGPAWMDWLVEQDGMHLVLMPVGPLANKAFVDEDVATGAQNAILGLNRTTEAFEADIRALGGEILLNTACTGLVKDGNAIVGVQVGSDASAQTIKANKGVILCSGGFGYNMDMLEKYAPSAYMYANQGGPTMQHTGEVIRMGVGAGADIAGYNSFCCWETGLDEYWGSGDGNYYHYMMSQGTHVAFSPFLRLDVRGNRIPVYSLTAPEYVGCPFSFAVESNAAMQMAMPTHNAYIIMDSNYAQYQAMFMELGACSPHLLGARSEVAQSYITKDWDEEFEELVERGAILKADTLEELEQKAGMVSGSLVKAVEKWNKVVASGVDPNPVPMPPVLMTPVEKGPFYCMKSGGQIGKTLAGLRINDFGQVLDTKGAVIEGLYAGFTAAGGYTGENTFLGQFGMVGPMGSVAMSGAGGYICARGLLNQLPEYDY